MTNIQSIKTVAGLLLAVFTSATLAQEEFQQVQQVIEIQASPDALSDGGAFFLPEIGENATVEVLSGDDDGVMIMSSSSSIGGDLPAVMGRNMFGKNAQASELMGLLQNKSIREEIDLVDAQYQKMKDFQKAKSKDIQKVIKDVLGGGKVDAKAIEQLVKKSQGEASKQLEDMLLPHQISRLRQVSRQVQMQQRGTAEMLTSRAFAKELGLNDEEKKDLRDKAKEIEKRVKAQIAKLKADARKELIDTLPADKQAKLKEMIGENFNYEKPDMRSRLEEFRKKMEDRRTERKIKES